MKEAGFSMTKVVATIGPGSDNPEVLQDIVDEGMRIMRINFSHATYDEAQTRLDLLRSMRGVHSLHGSDFNLRATLLDTQGPEIRTGELTDGEITLKEGDTLDLSTKPEDMNCGTASRLFVNYANLDRVITPGQTVLLDDGLIELTVTKVHGGIVSCVVKNSAKLGNRKGVNLPGVVTDLPALTDKDMLDLEWGVNNEVDFIAASFVRKGSDVRQIRAFVERLHEAKWGFAVPPPRIISKIENGEGLENFESILDESDGIMVARGDLGVEIPLQEVFLAQKRMVSMCNQAGKPVIVATQMLDSMVSNPRPTRAEVSDVGNAVLDGADAVMLSGETAKGRYPVESVRTMVSILQEADAEYDSTRTFLPSRVDASMGLDHLRPGSRRRHVMAVAKSAVKAGTALNAALIIVITKNGNTARLVARQRPQVPVMTFCSDIKVARQLQIHRGLFPVVTDHELTQHEALRAAKKLGWARAGDVVIVISSTPQGQMLGEQTLMRVAELV